MKVEQANVPSSLLEFNGIERVLGDEGELMIGYPGIYDPVAKRMIKTRPTCCDLGGSHIEWHNSDAYTSLKGINGGCWFYHGDYGDDASPTRFFFCPFCGKILPEKPE